MFTVDFNQKLFHNKMQFGPICLINPTTEGVMRCLTVGLSICKWDNFKSCGHFYGM